MSWTDLTFTSSHILTASDMNGLQDNFSAMAAGAVGVPPIAVNSLMASGVASIDTLYVNSAHVDLDAARIVSGTISPARLPSIPASQTTTGIFMEARVPFEAPGPIGSTTPGTGKFTTLETVGNVTLSAGFQIRTERNSANYYVSTDSSGYLVFVVGGPVGGSGKTALTLNKYGRPGFPNLNEGVGTDLVISGNEMKKKPASSRRFKKNIGPLAASYVKNVFDSLAPVQYSLREHVNKVYKDGGFERDPILQREVTETLFGFIAEDVYEFCPGMVSFDSEDRPEGLDHNQILALSVARIKELDAKVAALESEVALLKAN